METKFTEQESLSIIDEMINRARNNVRKGSGNSMIFWGTAIACIAMLNFIFVYLLNNPHQSFHVWWLVVPCWLVNNVLERRTEKETVVKTHIGKMIKAVWVGFVISYLLFLAIIFTIAVALKIAEFFWLITPVIMLMTGLSVFVTAKACRFRPLIYSAVCIWAGALASIVLSVLTESAHYQFPVLSACMLFGFVIPGTLMNKKAKKNV